MRVDPKSLLFLDITHEEADALMRLGLQIDQDGKLPDWDNDIYWFLWNRVTKYDDTKRLLIASTVFPAKCFASAAAYYQRAFEQRTLELRETLGFGPVVDGFIRSWEDQLAGHKFDAGSLHYGGGAEMKAIETFISDLKTIKAKVQ